MTSSDIPVRRFEKTKVNNPRKFPSNGDPSARIAWGITGAGSFLSETFDVMGKVCTSHVVSCYLTAAGERVVRIYGLWNRLKEICPGGYYREIILEREQGQSSPLAGRFLRKRYGALVVSPASANTVAKIVVGIADSLVTNAVAQAQKAGVPVVIVPTDQEAVRTTRLPPMVDREICQEHCGKDECPVLGICPHGAITEVDGMPTIDLVKCEGCRVCIGLCPYSAVTFGLEIEAPARKVDLRNVMRLRETRGFIVLESPGLIPEVLEKLHE